MKKLLAMVAVLVIGTWVTVPAEAGHHGCKSTGCEGPCAAECTPAACAPAPCAPATYVEKTVTCYRTEWRERDVPCTVNRVVQHVEIIPQTVTSTISVMVEDKHECMVTNCVAREVVENVTCCRMVQTCCTDPCTGCTHTVCKPETYVKQVKRVVFDQVPMKRVYTTHHCECRPVTKTIETKRVTCEIKPETVIKKERYCVSVPYQTTVKVAVCTPACAPAPSCSTCQ